ncbi:hypothetical protein GUJ93_ZPchr0004g39379 [Zizania palustris]|uniref:Uncharacterized protein n=1 Tax=Zizania palustris TaxID=103762 RepID=A0A8J5S0G1_ZIZPA|nr:hypothetical protein GUJ93_ZPchr0004g39379 [Zizania palustris]
MDSAAALAALLPSWSAAVVLLSYLGYLAAAGAILPGKLVAGALLPDSSRLHYRCNGLLSLILLLGLCALGVYTGWMSPTVLFCEGWDDGMVIYQPLFVCKELSGWFTG